MVNNMSDRNSGYLRQLIFEKEFLKKVPTRVKHVERLLDNEIARVQMELGPGYSLVDSELPAPEGPIVTIREKVFIPKDPPNCNYVGRILGPRGLTAKDLELKTGTKIQIRGRGSLRDALKEAIYHGTEGWEHLDDDLHVAVECTDAKNRAQIKVDNAVKTIMGMLVIPSGGMDELKRSQLMHLALIQGTYRPTTDHRRHSLLSPGPGNFASTPIHQGVYMTDGLFEPYHDILDPMYSPIRPFSPIPSPFDPQKLYSPTHPHSLDSYESATSPSTMFSLSSHITSPPGFEKASQRRPLTIKPASDNGCPMTPKSSRSFKLNQLNAMESPNWRAGSDKKSIVSNNSSMAASTIEHPATFHAPENESGLAVGIARLMNILDEIDTAQMALKFPTLAEFLESNALESEDHSSKESGSKMHIETHK